jgi:predicted flap endonuclease-1-like 5' DNA nuclease
MFMFLLQSAILLAIAFILGCIIGCWLRRMFADDAVTPTEAAVSATAAASAVAVAASRSAPAAPVAVVPEPQPAPVNLATPIATKAKAPAKKVTPKAKPALAKVAAIAVPAKPDDLELIVGVGPKNNRQLNEMGITRFAQIAGWTAKDEEDYGVKMDFPGRIEREEWVRQAKNLAAGGKPDAPKPRGSKAATSQDATATKVGGTKATKVAAAPVKKSIAVKLFKPLGGKPDNLTLINGIGNVLEKRLFDMGVFHFEQIANWTKDQAAEFGKAVGFPGRVERENWVKEAAIFAKGGTTEHARKVEAGDIPTSRKSTAAEKAKKK